MNALLLVLLLGAAPARAQTTAPTPAPAATIVAPATSDAPPAQQPTVTWTPSPVTTPGAPPLTLDEALDLARRNPQVAQAQAVVTQARGQVGVARSGFLPSGSASGRAGWTATAVTAEPSTVLYPTYGATVTLNQTLWDFGRTLGAFLAARDQERAARSGVDVAWQAVELSVRTSYYTVLATEALVTVADQTVESNRKQLELARGQFEVGQRPKFDVTTADVNLQQSIISQITAHDSVVLARIALSQSVGQDVARRPLLLPAVPDDILLDVPLLMKEALEARPDLRATDFGILAADENLSSAKSAWYPIVGVGASYTWNDSRLPVAGGLPAPDANSWNILGTLTWPFLNGGADLGRVETQTGVLEAARASRAQLLLQIRTDVEQAVATVNEARARRTVSRTLVEQARENLDLAQGRYQAGIGTIIDVTTSQTSYTSAQAQEVKAAFDLATAWAQLQHAIGR